MCEHEPLSLKARNQRSLKLVASSSIKCGAAQQTINMRLILWFSIFIRELYSENELMCSELGNVYNRSSQSGVCVTFLHHI